jgi:hypothetical protein
MGTLQVQVNPENPGTVTVQVRLAGEGTPLNETFQVTSASPLNQSWTLDPGLYEVVISWESGFQNIYTRVPGNAIIVNGKKLVFQVLGAPADVRGVLGTCGAQVT